MDRQSTALAEFQRLWITFVCGAVCGLLALPVWSLFS